MADKFIKHYPTAQWVSLGGEFSPQELREIADEIETQHAEFKKAQEKRDKEKAS